MKELEQFHSRLKDKNKKLKETLNIKTNQLARTLEDLKCQKEKSESEKKTFQKKIKILKEENNDFRNKNKQLHEALKIKINDLQVAEEYILNI